MENSILEIIENAIKSKNNDEILKVSSKLNIDVEQTKLFLKYFNKFTILSSILDSKYVNYFNKICLNDLREKDEITDENFAKSVSTFINEKQKNKELYYMKLDTNNDIKLHKLILSQITYSSFQYEIYENKELDYINNLDLFKYIPNIIDENSFDFLSKELIEKQIESPLINHINLNNIPYESVLEYSKKYKNRIKKLEWYGTEEYEKLKELMELNKESLEIYPHGKIQYLIPLPNATVFNLSDFEGEITENFDLSKITKVEGIIINYDDESSEAKIKAFLSKCVNLQEIIFYDISSDYLFPILEEINCPKIKIINATCEDIDSEYDWTNIFDKMPLLQKINIEEHQTMNWTYEIKPVFLAECKRIAFPLLEQLIRNYLNDSKDNDIKMQFDAEFDEFWDYFKSKNDILNKTSQIKGDVVHDIPNNFFKAVIDKKNDLEFLNAERYLYCYVLCDFDNDILDFVKKIKPQFLLVENGNVNLNELKNIQELKFAFIKNNKEFLVKNENNILEKI